MQNIAQKAINEFGRDGFYIRRSIKTDCTSCISGPDGQTTSTCTVCNNLGYVETVFYIPIQSIISWRTLEERTVLVGAVQMSGDCGIAITADDYKSINIETDEFLIDGKSMKLKKIIPSDQNVVYLLSFIYNEL
jgi:hypothetical protein